MAKVNARECEGVWHDQELHAGGDMEPCLGFQKVQNTNHFVGNGELSKSCKLGCAVVRYMFNKDCLVPM